MKYEQIIRKSRLYEYGQEKEFKTKEEALEVITKEKQRIGTLLSLEGLFRVEKREIEVLENAYQLVVTIKIPVLFEEKEE